MKKFLEKILDKYIEYKKREEKEGKRCKTMNGHDTPNYNRYNLDDYDDWTEDEAEDLLTWGKEGLLHN